jgi:hypothetical protein
MPITAPTVTVVVKLKQPIATKDYNVSIIRK